MKDNNPGSLAEGALLAVGGRYDYLLRQMWGLEHVSYTHLLSSSYLLLFTGPESAGNHKSS